MTNNITKNNEIESFILLKEIFDQKRQFEIILQKYEVQTPDEIESKIETGEIEEHPAYEDYLSALTLQQNIDEMKSLAKQRIEAF